ncbi:MAG: alpha/beta hydrolase fold domain-containing protein [Burkholderiaceae bacterium]
MHADGPHGPIALRLYRHTDMRRQAPSHATNGQDYLLTSDTIRYFHDHYIEDTVADHDWRASPLLHDDLSGLPETFMLTAGYDPLRDKGSQYSQRLTEAGNRVTHICFERQIHGFITMGRVIDEANAAVAICANVVGQALRQD